MHSKQQAWTPAKRLTVYLDAPTFSALVNLAAREDRDPRLQGARIIRSGLIEAGVLPQETTVR